jgi:hypothetical protein
VQNLSIGEKRIGCWDIATHTNTFTFQSPVFLRGIIFRLVSSGVPQAQSIVVSLYLRGEIIKSLSILLPQSPPPGSDVCYKVPEPAHVHMIKMFYLDTLHRVKPIDVNFLFVTSRGTPERGSARGAAL